MVDKLICGLGTIRANSPIVIETLGPGAVLHWIQTLGQFGNLFKKVRLEGLEPPTF